MTDIDRARGRLYVDLVDPTGESEGSVTLIFEDPDPEAPASEMKLNGWFAQDAMGGLTEVRLVNHERGVSFDPRLFVLDDNPFEDTRRGRRR